jgi:hypothetical protein
MGSGFAKAFAVTLLAGAGAALFFGNLAFARNYPGGNDFLPRWVGTQLYITHGQNPYSDETTAATQEAIYGRKAQAGEDQALFAYPFYAMIVFAPFALISDYAIARASWMTFQQVLLIFTVIWALRLGELSPRPVELGLLMLFGITWYHGARPLVDGNAAILVALLVTSGLLLLASGSDFWSGVLFALATIKPQMVLIFLGFVIIWTLLKRRYMVATGFSLTMIVLVGCSLLLNSSWILENLRQILQYQSYLPQMTPAGIGELWLGAPGRWIGLAINVIVGALLLYEWWNLRRGDAQGFLRIVCLTLAVSPLLGILSTSSNYAILLPVLILVWAYWKRKIGSAARKLIWMEAVLVFYGLWSVFIVTLKPGPQFRESEIMFFLMPIFLVANLYALREKRLDHRSEGERI